MPDGVNINRSVDRCTIPLLESDFQLYDTTPDNEFQLSEFTQDNLECFISRYVNTRDRDIRDAFRSSMASALQDKFRETITALSERDDLDEAVVERIEYILRHELPDDYLTYQVETEVELSGQNEHNVSNEYDYSSETSSYSFNGIGSLNLRLPLSIGQFNYDASLIGRVNNDNRNEMFRSQSSRIDENTDHTYPGHRIENNLEFYTYSGEYSAELNINLEHYYDPPPDHLIDQREFDASLNFENLFVEHLSLSIEASNSGGEYTAPAEESRTLRESESETTFDSELSYQIDNLGISSDYSFCAFENTSNFETDNLISHELSILGQYTSSEGYVRFGLGFGQYDTEELYRDGSGINLEEYAAYLTVKSKWLLSNNLGIYGNAEIFANRSEGTFMGWYPSWYADLTAELRVGDISLALIAAYSGHRISLNENQDRDAVGGRFSLSYRPWEWAKFTAYVSMNDKETSGLRASESGSESAGWTLSLNPTNSFWITFNARLQRDYFRDNVSTYNYNGWWAGLNLSLME